MAVGRCNRPSLRNPSQSKKLATCISPRETEPSQMAGLNRLWSRLIFRRLYLLIGIQANALRPIISPLECSHYRGLCANRYVIRYWSSRLINGNLIGLAITLILDGQLSVPKVDMSDSPIKGE